jgi:ribosomal RNA-processing protein 17
MASNNLARLTRAHDAVAAKRRAKRHQLAEVVFDDDARRSVLLLSHSRVLPSYQAQGVPYRFS